MNNESAKARAIFITAVENYAPDRWGAMLDEACREDADLRRRVEKLLRAHQGDDSFLDRGDDDETTASIAEGPGTVIGPYRLIQLIGEGGFGVVFLAEQERPVKRRVALKVIKPGMDTRQVIARFEAERQALALMDHPCIAKVYDAGTTGAGVGVEVSGSKTGFSGQQGNRAQGSGVSGQVEEAHCNQLNPDPRLEAPSLTSEPRSLNPITGRPYFVMELVHGVPITEYCDECNLTTNERLELFVLVCQAVQHAHQKGIIHRDIKPTNVLVAMQDGRPTPKIIDFGVAKAIGEQTLTERTLTTAFAQMIGTPMYMSPEQAELSPLGVDTRSDIYSLGVMLYELLTGLTPFDHHRLHEASYDEFRRIIREEDPPRPSARISTLAADLATTVAEHRRTNARGLRQAVGGDLDWIVMKCLEKDRNRRYESSGGLARDIERYLHDEAVQACPPSIPYRLKKFLRRNRVAAAFLATLTIGIVGLALSNIALKRERDAKTTALKRATNESARAQAVSTFLVQMIFSPSRGWQIKGDQYTVREMLDDYSAKFENQPEGQPEVEAELRHAFGTSYLMLGVPDQADRHLKQAIKLGRSFDGPPKKRLADSLANYGLNLYLQRSYDEAEPPLREALEIYRNLGVRGTQPLFVFRVLQLILAANGRHGEAARIIQQAWSEMEDYDKFPPKFTESPAHDVVANCTGFAYYFATIGKQEQAAEFLRRATFAQKRLQKPIDSLGALQFLASTQLRLGDESGYREACRALAVPAPHIASDEFHLGRIITCTVGPDAVKDPSILVKQAEEIAASNALHAPFVDLALLGTAHYRAGHYEEAAKYLEQSIAQYPSNPPPSHGTVLWPQLFLALTKWQQGKHDDARRLLREIQPAIDEFLDAPMFMWQRRLNMELVNREAKNSIEPKEADDTVEDKGPPSHRP